MLVDMAASTTCGYTASFQMYAMTSVALYGADAATPS